MKVPKGIRKIISVKYPFKKPILLITDVLILLFFLFSVIFFVYHLIFINRIVPGVKIADLDFSGNTYSEAYSKLNTKNSYYRNPLSLKINGELLMFVPLEAGISIDATESARSVYLVGRSRSLWKDVSDEINSFIFGNKLLPIIKVDNSALDMWLEKMVLRFATKDAKFEFVDGNLTIKSSNEGIALSKPHLKESVFKTVLNFGSQVNIDADKSVPSIPTAKLEDLKGKILSLYYAKPSVFFEKNKWEISDEDFLSMFDFKTSTVSGLAVNKESVSGFIKKVSASVNRMPKSVSFKADGSKVVSFEPGVDGLTTDETELAKQIGQALIGNSTSSSIEVPVIATKPPVAINNYGIKELIGEGTSVFSGSIEGRRKNIKTASTKLNGILIAPDATFSFNESVGEVTAQTGYDYAYIISEGRTVLGTGGGVCQVSTTVFRAALNSGLPILKRTAHAYRVHYYEEGGSPVGFDSTVFSPSVDLEFKNDTGNYILVQSIFEGEHDRLTFRFYGSSDGRKVKIDGPVFVSTSGAPTPKYQDDPTLPKGTTIQVDFAAPGATVYFKRLVTRGDQILYDDTFYSRYAPWQAIYLVGTKE